MKRLIIIIIIYALTEQIFGQNIKYDIADSRNQINQFYSSNNKFSNLLKHFNEISESKGIREHFFDQINNSTKIDRLLFLFENSSSGESYSYNVIGIGTDKKGKYIKLDYTYYSGKEKLQFSKFKKADKLLAFLNDFNKTDYDNSEKVSFPSELIILLVPHKNKRNYWISKTPDDKTTNFIINFCS